VPISLSFRDLMRDRHTDRQTDDRYGDQYRRFLYCKYASLTMPEEDQAMATCNMHREFDEIQTFGF